MGRFVFASTLALTFALSSVAFGQGGFGGGGQGGGLGKARGGAQQGGFGGGQGQQGRMMDGSVGNIESAIQSYLNGDEIRSLLTPGEFCEWTMNLKAGQVVISEARSDAFDPALEMVDDKNKVLASNDDRYLGDQRPLLLWRCEKDGAYALHVRCFHDKSGGQVFVRFKTYDSVDLGAGEKVEKELDSRNPFLLRIPMKAGQIKEVLSDQDAQKFMRVRGLQVIAPGGLPDINLSHLLQPITGNSLLIAPVAGDYFMFETADYEKERGKVRVWTREIVPGKLTKEANTYIAQAPTHIPACWEISVKAGDLLSATTPDLGLASRSVVAEQPEFAKWDVRKPETNPFFPQPTSEEPHKGPAIAELPGRARDSRVKVFCALRDAKLWVASNGGNQAGKQFTLMIKPAATDFAEAKANVGKLRLGCTDYWAIDAKAGDVMTLDSGAPTFTESVLVRDPELNVIRNGVASPDQTSEHWQMIVQKPGRYLVSVACMGDGGGGEYSLSRKVLHANEFAVGHPAQGDIAPGEIQIWKFTAKPDQPLFIHWSSTKWSYDTAIYDEKGNGADFQRDRIDDHNAFGILKVDEPHTYLIVLQGGKEKASYSLELNGIPGYRK